MIHVVDYGRGNLFSLSQALRHLGVEHRVTSDPAEIAGAARVILPGVGAFGDAMAGLTDRGLVAPLQALARKGVPLLGICVGMQLLVDGSDEFGSHAGLGLIPGWVRRLPEGSGAPDDIRIPNVGWRRLEVAPQGALADLPPDTMVYFVHSFAPVLAEEQDRLATIRVNGARISAAIKRGSVSGFQFHPEKSGPAGLDLLRRFAEGRL